MIFVSSLPSRSPPPSAPTHPAEAGDRPELAASEASYNTDKYCVIGTVVFKSEGVFIVNSTVQKSGSAIFATSCAPSLTLLPTASCRPHRLRPYPVNQNSSLNRETVPPPIHSCLWSVNYVFCFRIPKSFSRCSRRKLRRTQPQVPKSSRGSSQDIPRRQHENRASYEPFPSLHENWQRLSGYLRGW